MHSSLFSYTLSKNYPYRWFTPVVLIGGLVFLVLFSLLNFASSGYTLVTIYSCNPNATTDQTWLAKWPSILTNKARSQCEPASISIGTQLLTNNSALTYTLTNVNSSSGNLLPSLNYLNNPLQDCKVTSITTYLDHTEDRNAAQIRFSRWGADTQGRIMCNVTLDSLGPTTLNLTVGWNPIPASVSTYDFGYTFLGRNSSTQASLWWGESLLSSYFAQVTSDMNSHETETGSWGGNWTKAEVTLTPNSTVTDITDLRYYNVTFRGINEDESGEGDTGLWANPDGGTIQDLFAADSSPNIWIGVDSLGKSLESTALADLGQLSARPNILTDPNLLEYFTANFSKIKPIGPYVVGPAREDYDTLKATIGQLGLSPSTLATNYICNVPKRKPTSDLVISIAVADLVFMKTLWTIFTFIIGLVMRRKDSRTDWCERCSSSVDTNRNESKSAAQSEYEKLLVTTTSRSDLG